MLARQAEGAFGAVVAVRPRDPVRRDRDVRAERVGGLTGKGGFPPVGEPASGGGDVDVDIVADRSSLRTIRCVERRVKLDPATQTESRFSGRTPRSCFRERCPFTQSNTQLSHLTTDRFRTDRLPRWGGTDAALAALKTSRSGMRANKLSIQPGINPLGYSTGVRRRGETPETATGERRDPGHPSICPTCPVRRYALALPASAMTYPSSSRPLSCWSRSLLGMALLDADERLGSTLDRNR